MGLAPYGEPRYVDLIKAHLIDIKPDGTFRLDMRYFNYATGLTMTNLRFDRLFGGPPRQPEAELTQREMDIAASIQVVTEEIVLKLANTIHAELGTEHLCLAGGVALNCVANGRLDREGPFRSVWIQPAAGDAGGALGAALATWHQYLDNPASRMIKLTMRGAYLGKAFDQSAVESCLEAMSAPYRWVSDDQLMPEVAGFSRRCRGWMAQWTYGIRSRALGARSILGDARSPKMQSVMNLKIKNRESFRPFAPALPPTPSPTGSTQTTTALTCSKSQPSKTSTVLPCPTRKRRCLVSKSSMWPDQPYPPLRTSITLRACRLCTPIPIRVSMPS